MHSFLGMKGISGGSGSFSDNAFVLYLGSEVESATSKDLEVCKTYFSVAYDLLGKEDK